MQENKFFGDTYAIMELIKRNPTYESFQDVTFVTTAWNLAEMYYNLLREYNIPTANHFLAAWENHVVAIKRVTIQKGMQFKHKHQRDRLSHVDCIGYALANELGIKFLTGDIKFKGLENVEFVV